MQEPDVVIWETLLDAACAAASHAYCPYSGLAVGAAVLGGNGRVYAGCNVENASYGLTVCAERAAACAAVADGGLPLRAVAIVGPGDRPLAPCGACRQVLLELAPGAPIVLAGGGQTIRTTVDDLLPAAFSASDLPGPRATPPREQR